MSSAPNSRPIQNRPRRRCLSKSASPPTPYSGFRAKSQAQFELVLTWISARAEVRLLGLVLEGLKVVEADLSLDEEANGLLTNATRGKRRRLNGPNLPRGA